jgi:3-deoxy-manno-octulosonate cytidylyltransferase (CMP-KDO synthetase)
MSLKQMKDFVIVIPARYASTRLPGKPLRQIAGKPMVQHVYERGVESGAAEVVIATDDARIVTAAAAFSADCFMTSADHSSGTDRLAEVAEIRGWADERIIVNLQGDEPLMPAELIGQCAGLLVDESADVATLASAVLSAEDFHDPNVVKVVTDSNGFALYFSRAPIPFSRNAATDGLAQEAALHHHGIYAYRRSVLRKIVAANPSPLEKCEQLEQLRVLHLGMSIKVGQPGTRPGRGVDTEADLADVQRLMGAGADDE